MGGTLLKNRIENLIIHNKDVYDQLYLHKHSFLDYLKKEYSFLKDEYSYELYFEYSFRGENSLQYINKKSKRKINIDFDDIGYTMYYEITIEKNYKRKIILNNLVVLDTKFGIKEYSKEISKYKVDMKEMKYNDKSHSNPFRMIIFNETPLFKFLMKSHLKDIISAKKWINWKRERKINNFLNLCSKNN
ncbi:MAG: hypothetical protein CVV25_07260 [Ignavibacteriae bacterium HGW-Ignavibacteriae-4]|jgi:hypothetical protein|nr:MAG: hypothetical protein CVV25_07260 [Ignavibacteriae bacterium HGW-Ignavibacteriae-4]